MKMTVATPLLMLPYLPAAVFLFAGCSSHRSLVREPKVLIIVSTPAPAAPNVIDSTIDSVGASEEPQIADIDSLIDCADSVAQCVDFNAAHTLLRKAIQTVKENEENDADESESEEYYRRIAGIYTESMPPVYADSIPDEISLLLFRKQLSSSLDSMKLSPSDSVLLQQSANIGNMTYDIPIVWNNRVYKALYFLNRGGKGSLDKWIFRSLYYMPTIRKMFVDSGLPADLAYLPLIESGFNPLAYSRKHAVGMWQFIYSTGKRFGLQKDCWIDERRDFIKSTRAAIGYFKKLYCQFNDWHIAIGAYNCGESSMSHALTRARSKDFWSLSLPRETMHYVPEFIAALIVAKNPNYSDSVSEPVDTFNCDTVTVSECLSLYAIADTLCVSSNMLRTLNPHVLHWCTHPRMPVTLYLPAGTKEKFERAFDLSPSDFIVSWYSYKVKSGENIYKIAQHFKVPIDVILSLNSRSFSQRISVGQNLLIPIPTNQSASRTTIIRNKPDHTAASFKTVVINGAKVIKYRIRPGECLWGIAQLFRVDKNDLCGWNNISDEKNIRAGTILNIYKSPEMHKVLVKSLHPSDSCHAKAAAKAQSSQSLSDTQKPASLVADASSQRIVYYRVRKGDNLRNIAQSFKVAVRQLTSINDLTPGTALMPGKVIKVPLLEEL